MNPQISIIAAIANNGVIGYQGRMPWRRIKIDMNRFWRITFAKPVIMGRKTYESIGRPLPDRWNIVISRQWSYNAKDCDVVPSLKKAIALAKHQKEIMIIGGAQIYEQAFDLDAPMNMYITQIHDELKGDTYFPFFETDKLKIGYERVLMPSTDTPYKLTFIDGIYDPR